MNGEPPPAAGRVRIGISACLLGRAVRWDGGHKRDAALLRAFSGVAEWVPVCPELEAGLGVPRPPLRLVPGDAGPRLVEVDGERDRTEEMIRWMSVRLEQCDLLGLDGYVTKAGSPSCGLSMALPGLFASALCAALPDLPVEEAERLADPDRLADFRSRVLAHSRRLSPTRPG